MDFENLFSKPPNPALGKKPASDSDERIDDEIDDTEVEETREEKIKWELQQECEEIPKKHFGNTATSPKTLLHRKSRSKDCVVYSDVDTCDQEPEDDIDKEFQKYIQEVANAVQPIAFLEESIKKEEAEYTKPSTKPKNKKLKASHKKGKQKKMKRKWPDAGNRGSFALPKNSGPQEEFQHFGNAATSPKSLLHRKSRSKDYDVDSDDNTCNQEPEDDFDKELQKYIQAKEMANAVQPIAFPEESVKKEGAECTQPSTKPKNKKLKASHKKGKQKKMKRKWPDAGNRGSFALPKNSGPQEEDGAPKEKQPLVRMSQEFINHHTVEHKGKQVCKYFLERKCIKGDQCKFDHDTEIEKKKEMCKFYVQGYCTRGEDCLYLHNEYPCKFYHTGTKCYQGEHCLFSHAPLTAETQELLAKVLNPEKKSSK